MLVATQIPQALNPEAGRELNTTLTEAWVELRGLTLPGMIRAILFLRLDQHFLGDNVVYWSLLPEALFYLIVPLAFWRIRWYYVASVVLFLVGLYCNWRGIALNVFSGYALTHNFYFAAGIGLYDIIVATNWLVWVQRLPRGGAHCPAWACYSLMLRSR